MRAAKSANQRGRNIPALARVVIGWRFEGRFVFVGGDVLAKQGDGGSFTGSSVGFGKGVPM